MARNWATIRRPTSPISSTACLTGSAASSSRALPRTRATDVFAYLVPRAPGGPAPRPHRCRDARSRSPPLSPDDRTALLAELPAIVTQRLLTMLTPEDLAQAPRQLLGYPETSVGRLMTPDPSPSAPTGPSPAPAHVRATGRDAETIDVVHVTDERDLLDDLRLRALVLADPETSVLALMDGGFIALRATDDREEAVRAMGHHDRTALPVVDSGGAPLGIVTVDDVLDVAEEEATEDFQKWAASKPSTSPTCRPASCR
ncbi:MAG: CBS domain-containing protein [Thermomicrobiales bacterium]